MAKKRTKKQAYYVAVPESTELKTDVLEVRRSVLRSMQAFQSLKQLRKQKTHEKSELRKIIRQINISINKIKSTLPPVDISNLAVKEPPKKDNKTKKVEQVVRPKKEPQKTELQKIEDELQEVESKLNALH